ncbi:MAG TPA: hypothetical protein VM013_05075, partial [Dehalococcoidia bacterium]|nr:hypothetical protein [Dehalococcoidia bacterium]
MAKLGEAWVLIGGDSEKLKRAFTASEHEAGGFVASVGRIIETGIGVALGNLATKAAELVGRGLKQAITGLGTAAYNAAIQAAPLQGILDGFAVSAAKASMGSEEFLAALNAASNGMVTQINLMKAANVALTGAEGAFAEEFGRALPTLLEAARVAAKRTGQDVTFLFD